MLVSFAAVLRDIPKDGCEGDQVYAEVTSYAMRCEEYSPNSSDVTLSQLFQTKTLRVTGMAALSITSPLSFNAEEQKSVKKGENYFKSGHVESFTYNQGVLRGDVHVSMTNKLYKFTVG